MKNKLTILLLLTILCSFSFAQAPSANFTAAVSSGCSPLIVDFKDMSTGSPTSYLWDFGNGATSTLANPSTTYFNSGTYTVKLTVTNASGSHTLVRENYITIYERPSVNFKVNDSIACSPHQAVFTDLSTAAPGTSNVSWLWDFGNGTQSTEQNPQVTYTNAGNYTVTLKVTSDKGCSRVLTKQQYINIIGSMNIDFSNTMAATCKPPFNITFNSTATGPGTLSYKWDFGDGTTSTLKNPSHTYTDYGNYDVKLTVTSSAGCTVNLIKQGAINVQEIKTNFTSPENICAGSTVTFQNTSTPAPVSSKWVFSDGTTSTEINAIKSFTTPGIYTIKLYNTYTYCIDSASSTIEVLPKPTANFTTSGTISCKPPLIVNFNNSSIGAVNWLWDFGDGTTSTLQNPSHTYTSYGRFDVKLLVTNSFGCTDSITRDDLIEIVQPTISFNNLPVEGCIPYTINPVANIATLDAVTSYLWDFGNGVTSTLQNPSYTYTEQGTYTVKLTITTSLGCTETYTMSSAVVVGRVPIIDFKAVPNPVCAFQEIQFTNLTNEGNQWQWFFGDGGRSNEQHPKHEYSDTGTLDVMLVVTNNGCIDTLEKKKYVTIKPPIAKFGLVPNCNDRFKFNFRDSSIGATTWFWDFGDGKTSTQQHPTHTFTSFGNYSVTLTVTNDTCSHKTTKIINVFDEAPDFTASTYNACRVADITFTSTTGNAGNIINYNWDFGQGQSVSSGNSSMTSTYQLSGSYDVRLVTTDFYGCFDTINKKIKITGPTANFIANNTKGCKGLVTTFTDRSTDDGISKIVNWQWHFGDGAILNSKTGTAVQHVYTTAGTFSVKLVITDATGCKDSLILADHIFATVPIANFIADTLTCPNASVKFNNSSNAVNYTSVWSFGDGNSSTLTSPEHAYTTNGSFEVRLTITDEYGCSDDTVITVISDLPDASFSVSDSVSSCAPFEVIFTNTSKYYNTAYWVLNGGTSTAASPIQYYNLPGEYKAQLFVTSPGGCIDSAEKTIYVYDTIGTKISYNPLNGCKPLDIDIAAFSKGPMKYTWDFGDGVIVNTDSSKYKHVYNTFGEFIPKVIMTDPSGCVFAVPGPDTIRIKGANVNFGYDKKLFCDSGYVSFTDSTTFNDPIASYNWNFGDGNISALQQPVHQFTSPGIYSVSLSVLTQAGCTDTMRLTDIIKVVQSPMIGINGDSVICIHERLLNGGVFLRSDTSAVSWKWNFPNGATSNLQNPPIQQYNSAGSFIITATAINSSGCTDTTTKPILVNPLPVITVPSTITMQVGFPITIPATYSSNVAAYTWTPSTGLSCTDCPQPEANPKSDTRYNIAVVDSNGCKNNEYVQIIVICKNGNVFVPNTFSPNGDGTNDVFYVRGKGLDRVKSLRIFNRWGEIVFEQRDFPVNNPQYGWNGMFKGNKPQADVYVYQVEVYCDNSEIIRFEGNVALIQ